MASPKGMSSTLLTLAGYLELHQKSWRGNKRKKYWFWFDEQTCHLKYFRNQEAYQQKLFEPLGTIDLRYATITPPMAADGLAADQFQITTESQVYTLAAEDTDESHRWIRNLQDKREQWIRRDSALGMTDLDRQSKKKSLKPLHERPGGVLAVVESAEVEDQPTVRKIVSRHMQQCDRHSLPADTVLGSPVHYPPDVRAATKATHGHASLSKSLSDSGRNPVPGGQSNTFAITTLGSTQSHNLENRELLQLQHEYLKSQEEVTKLQKEVIRLKERMEKRNEEIVKLHNEIDVLKESLAKSKAVQSPEDKNLEIDSLKDIIEQYKRSVKSLVDEIDLHKLHECEHDRRIGAEKQKVAELEKELSAFKTKYIVLLSDKFKVVVPNPAGAVEGEEDPEEEQYTEELLKLLKMESEGNDLFNNYKSTFKDQYGDQHDWQSGTTVQHYLCRQLYLHYTTQEQEELLREWMDFLKPVKKLKGKLYLDLLPGNDRAKRTELRNLLRKGVPIQYRTQIWTSLVYRLIGRVKEVKDSTAGPETTYYQSLLNSKNESASEKQILLDQYRTLPSNSHFRSGGQGVQKLKNVLTAYSHHNRNVGYCQGMNLIAAIALLFVDEETAFWFLDIVIEKLLPAAYFTPGLLGVQADQAVLRDLLPQKLPRLSSHLDLHAIDVTLVTFNWFLTLFIDAMPTESVLRILDCFLLEGSKVLYRVALGLLKVNARRMLSITDPVGLFQMLKEIAKHSFDIDHLLKVAFTELEPFPNRSTLLSRHQHHYSKIREQWVKRERELKEREARSKLEKLKKQPQQLGILASFRERQKARRHLVWECGCVRQTEDAEEAWLCCGDRQQGRIAIVTATDGHFSMEVPSSDVSSRVICIGYVSSDVVILGTLDFNIHAFHCSSKKILWSVKMNDSVLAIESTKDGTVFTALADGFVAVLQNVSTEVPDSDPLLIRIGSDSVPCLALASAQKLWCGCGKAITILSSQTFEPVHSIAIEEPLGKLYKMETSQYGVWVSFRSSSVVSLFDVRLHVSLMQVDYTSLLSTDHALSHKLDSRVTSIMASGDYLWLGTGSGTVFIFSVHRATAEPEQLIQQVAQANSKSNAEVLVEEEAEQKGLLSDQGGLVQERLEEGEVKESAGSGVAREPTSRPGRRLKERTDYYQQRRTAFGRTLRGPSVNKGRKQPAIFRLVYNAEHQLAEGGNDSVKVILPLSGPGYSLTVSCVHSVMDWGKGMQAWHCQGSPDKWSFQYLPMSPNHILEDPKSAFAELPGDLGATQGPSPPVNTLDCADTSHHTPERSGNALEENSEEPETPPMASV